MNVLIVFYSHGGNTERLALTAGVGAIQARANIRLRRLPPGQEIQTDAATTEQRQILERLSRDYTAPRSADPLWADVIMLAAPPEGASDLEAYVERLPALGTVAGKIAAPLACGQSPQVLRPIYAAAAHAGLLVVPMPSTLDSTEAQHAFGRRVVTFARALKTAQTP